MAPRLLIALAMFFMAAAPARADLVQLNWTHGGDRLARAAGGTELAPELRIWRVPAYAVADLRRAGVVRLSHTERLVPTLGLALQQATDPLVPQQWWRVAVGADKVDSPGPGEPVTVVDSGIDLTHPEFASRPNTTALNRQTIDEVDEDHGTEVSSVIGAPNNGVGVVGVYPDAVLRVWDASPFGFLSEGSAIQGIYEAAKLGPGVINLSFGGEDDDPLLDDAIRFAFREGSLIVAAAGNDGSTGSPPNYPAFYPHVLTVAATNEDNRVAAFSSISPTVDLAAPGVHIPVAEPSRRRSLRLQHRRERHKLCVAARRRRCGLGMDRAPRSRQHTALRADAPLRDRHRRAGLRQFIGLWAAQHPEGAGVQDTEARSAGAERAAA